MFEFENRFCASDDVCNDIEMLCAPGNGTKNNGNATSQCWYKCCNTDLCNSTSRVNYTLLFIAALAAMVGVIIV